MSDFCADVRAPTIIDARPVEPGQDAAVNEVEGDDGSGPPAPVSKGRAFDRFEDDRNLLSSKVEGNASSGSSALRRDSAPTPAKQSTSARSQSSGLRTVEFEFDGIGSFESLHPCKSTQVLIKLSPTDVDPGRRRVLSGGKAISSIVDNAYWIYGDRAAQAQLLLYDLKIDPVADFVDDLRNSPENMGLLNQDGVIVSCLLYTSDAADE